ncbi:MAG: hypothetical protein PHV82_18800, partial [Victivallaceae bacterium]|nr:hypothetical protein [Victivallaceae bacterium]
VIPWFHHMFTDANAVNVHQIIQPHAKGLDLTGVKDDNTSVRSAIKGEANWSAYYNRKNQTGMLMISATPAKLLYSWNRGTPQTMSATIEMMYDKLNPVPQAQIDYYLIPIINSKTACALPVKAVPSIPADFAVLKHLGGKRSSYSQFANKYKEKIPLRLSVETDTLYVSKDFFLPMFLRISGTQSKKPAQLTLDLPETLELKGFMGRYWRFNPNEKIELKEQKKIIRENENYTRYIFALDSQNTGFWRFFIKAKKAGACRPLYYSYKFSSQRIAEHTLPVEIIDFPQAKTPRLFTAIFEADYALLKDYTDDPKALKLFKHLGFNGIALQGNVPCKEVPAETVKEFLQDYKKNGFITAIMRAGYFRPPAHKDLQAIDIDGELTTRFDFTARGEWMGKIIKRMLDDGDKSGFDLLISDWEPYTSGGHRVSFTQRTIDKFKSWFTAKYPKMEYVDPLTLAKHPHQYPERYNSWVNFKCEQLADYVKKLVDETQRHSKIKIGWCTISGLSVQSQKVATLSDQALISQNIDYNMPMLYNDLYESMPQYKETLNLFIQAAKKAKRAKIWPTLTSGLREKPSRFPLKHSFYIMLETAFSQAGGCFIWPGFPSGNGKTLYWMSRALNIIAEYEEILFKGQRMDELVQISGALNIKNNVPAKIVQYATVKDDNILVYLAEYSPDPVSCEVKFHLPHKYRVYNVSAGLQRVAELGPGNNSLKLTLQPGEKGIILLLKSSSGQTFPADFKIAKAQPETAVPDKENLLLYDGFENKSLGTSSALNKYNFMYAQGKVGQCLIFSQYQADWQYLQELSPASGALTIYFSYRPAGIFKKGGRHSKMIAIIRLIINSNIEFTGALNREDGKFSLVQRQLTTRARPWKPPLSSKIDT